MVTDQGRLLYGKVCDLLGIKEDELYYYNGIKSYKIDYNNTTFDFRLLKASYSKDAVKAMLAPDGGSGSKEYNLLLNWMFANRNFHGEPFMVRHAFLTRESKASEQGFFWREGLTNENWIEESQKVRVEYNTQSGTIKVYTPICKVNKSYNSAINKMFEIIFDDPAELKSFKQLLALFTFEDRGGLARPTFIMFGARGSGKNLLSEYVFAGVFPGQTKPIAINSESFSGYLENKGVIIDENAKKKEDLEAQYEFIKQTSGQRFASVNKKQVEAYNVLNTSYMFILANNQPLHIKDEIKSSKENQFLVFYVDRSKTEEFGEFKAEIAEQGYVDISDLIDKCLGHYITTELFDIYKELKLECKQENYRYGMDVPLTAGLKAIKDMSVSIKQTYVDQVFYDLIHSDFTYYENQPKFTDYVLAEAQLFKNKDGFLSFNALKAMCAIRDIKAEHVNWTLKNKGFVEKPDTSTTYPYRGINRRSKGMKIDMAKLVEYMNEMMQEVV